jgi:non-specific protein-tyrosine kinase
MSQPDLKTLSEPRSSASEAYRTLRTNLEFSSLDHPLRSLLVTSPAPNVDKLTTLANLAVIMAEGGRHVLLVDSDLRKPELHTVFGLDNGRGLGNLLEEHGEWTDLPIKECGIEGLRLLPGGQPPQNPSVLLGTERMEQLIERLTGQADLVILNAPPVLAVTDAAVLAAKVDGTLLVVRAGGTQREHLRKAKALLDKVNARLVGAVLSNARVDASVSNYYE